MIAARPFASLVLAIAIAGVGRSYAQASPVTRSAAVARRLLSKAVALSAQALAAVPMADTVASADSIRVLYFVANGARPVRFRNDPGQFHFQVWGPDGERLLPQRERELPTYGATVDLTIPGDGIVGRVVNLECYRSGLAPTGTSACLWGFNLARVGSYRIVVSYDWLPPPGAQDTHRPILSDTILVYRSPR